MTFTYRMLQTAEFKDMQVTGPMVDQIMGTAKRAAGRFEGEITDVFIFCRSTTPDARSRAKEHEKGERVEITFVEVKD